MNSTGAEEGGGWVLPVTQYEQNFVVQPHIDWMRERWPITILISALYYLLITYGQRYMAKRSALSLRIPLVLWSGTLAVFSWLGTLRISVFLVLMLKEHGWESTVCEVRDKLSTQHWFWLYLFVLSKLPELGDTAFIVLRKSKMSFLHWYHHITVFIYSFYLCAYPRSNMIWYCGMNFAVHALMYTYYTLRALKVQLPGGCAMFVTVCQTTQMLVGVAIQLSSLILLQQGRRCDTSNRDIACAFCIYGSYMLLFLHFFYGKYCKESRTNKGGLKKES